MSADKLPDFAQIWERQGLWLGGPSFLMDFIVYWRDEAKSPVVVRNIDNAYQLYVQLPIPRMQEEMGGYEYSALLPELVKPIFVKRCNAVLKHRKRFIDAVLKEFPKNETLLRSTTLRHINQCLAVMEHELVMAGAKPIWRLAYESFGLEKLAPQPAGLLWRDPAPALQGLTSLAELGLPKRTLH